MLPYKETIVLFKSSSENTEKDKYVHVLEGYFQVVLISPIAFDFCDLSSLANKVKAHLNYSGLY